MSYDPSPQSGPGGASRAAQRKAHIKRLRRRAIAVSLVCFVLFWGAITARMAAGDDPVFGSTAGGSSTVAGQATPTVSEEGTATASEGSREGAAVEEELFGEAETRPTESEASGEKAQVEPEPIQTGQS